jgi:predicted transcriptional regulator
MAPYRRPPISDDAANAIEEVLTLHLEVERLDRDRRQAAVLRAGAVIHAMEFGASQNEIAKSLGITGEAVRQWGTNSPPTDPVQRDIEKRRLEALIDTLVELRTQIVTYLLQEGVTPRSGTQESLAFVAGCEKLETKLDALGSLAVDQLGKVRQFAQNQGFTTNDVNQSIFEVRQLLREISK